MKYVKILMILFFIFLPARIVAMDPYKPINLYERSLLNMDNGLPSNTVYCITQSKDGYFWFGTLMGAVRFDGIAVEVFNSENTAAFKTDTVYSILEDNTGTIWMATAGSGIVRYKNGLFSALTTSHGLLSNEVVTLLESRDGTIWIGTSIGLNRYVNGKIMPVPFPSSQQNCRVTTLLEDRNGTIWSGTIGGGILLTFCKDDRLETEPLADFNTKDIFTILEDRMGRIWIASIDEGVIRLKGKQRHIYNTKNGLPVNYIHSLYEDRNGNILIGTYGGGLCTVPAGEEKVRTWNGQNVPGCHSVMAIYEDRESNIWMATDSSGLTCFRNTPITTYTRENGLSNDCVFGVFQDSRDNLWCGTIGFGLNRLNLKNNHHQFKVFTKKDGFSSDSVQSFAEYPKGTVWFGTIGGGISRLSLDSGRVEVLNKKNGLLNDFVFSLYVDRENNLWAGTNYGGLHRFSSVAGKFIPVDNYKRRLVDIYQDKQGNLWSATSGNGLWLRNTNKRIQYSKKDGFQDDRVICIYEDITGRMWFGTLAGGMNTFSAGDKTFRHLGKKDGLPVNAVYGIIEDNKHHLWLSTDNGILCLFRPEIDDFIAGKTTQFKPYRMGLSHGMKGIDCSGANQPMIWKDRDGRLWIPTSNGLSVVNPDNIQKNTVLPPVHVKRIYIDGLQYPITRGKPLLASPGQGNLEIHYSAPSSIAPGKIAFKYKLEGVDKNWVDAGTRRVAFYTFLPPGPYTFHVMACNSDGVWNNSGASLPFRLKAYYYQTTIFKIVSGLALLAFTLLTAHAIQRFIGERKQRRAFNGKVLPEKEQQEYLRKILYLLEVEKIYRDPNITVKTFSAKLITSARTISFIINDHLKKSFFELINFYRVQEARKILTHSERSNKSVIDIGFDVGFNSKSSFNRVFKSMTQMTPSQYRKKHNHAIS